MNRFGTVIENVDLKNYTTFGIGGICKYLVKPGSVDLLIGLINHLKEQNIKYYILGNGSNVILDDSYFDGVIIKLDAISQIAYDNNEVTVGAGVMLPLFVSDTLAHGFISLDFAAMIPGTVGGSIIGNAGAYKKELMDYVKSIKVLTKDNEVKILNKDEIDSSYRDTSLKGNYIVLEVTFTLEQGDVELAKTQISENRKKRIETQPLDKKSVGSIFRNPEGDAAGRIIEQAGLKGYRINGAMVSEKHANFIVNENNATFNDVTNLIKYIKNTVKEKYNIELKEEPIIVRWNRL